LTDTLSPLPKTRRRLCADFGRSLCTTKIISSPRTTSSGIRGTKNKALRYNAEGSLTIYVQSDPPLEAQRGNWCHRRRTLISPYTCVRTGRRRKSRMGRGRHPPSSVLNDVRYWPKADMG